MWLLISLDSCLCCEDVIKSKLVYTVLMRPKIRPKNVAAVIQRHVKNHFQSYVYIFPLFKGLCNQTVLMSTGFNCSATRIRNETI